MFYRLKLISHKERKQPNCLTRELKSHLFGNFLHRLVSCLLLNTESGKIFACFVWQNQIIQTCETIIFVFLLVKLSVPTQPGWRKTELLRQQSFQDISPSLSFFFLNMQLQNIWLLTVKAVILHLHTNYFPSTHSLENMCNSSRYIIYERKKRQMC